MNLSEIRSQLVKHKLLIFLFCFSGILASIWESRSETQVPAETDFTSADTYIPAGFVLVPIEVQNIEALDSILGRFGVVDLFTTSGESGSPSRLVAQRAQILRAPLKPDQFAVLVPEDQSAQIVKHSGPFYVVIQNPKIKGTNFVRSKSKMSRIEVEISE